MKSVVINVGLISKSDILARGLERIFADTTDICLAYSTDRFIEYGDLPLDDVPRIFVIDICCSHTMPVSELKAFVSSYRNASAKTGFIIMTDISRKSYFDVCCQLGIRGYCLRIASGLDLTEIVRVVAQGGLAIHSNYAAQMTNSDIVIDGLSVLLSKRHKQILHLMLEGLSNNEIAELLCLTIPTIKSHITAILKALNVRDRAQALSLIYNRLLSNAKQQPLL